MATETTITFKGVYMEVKYTYEAGEPDVYYMANGDPGYPGSPEELIVEEVMIGGEDCTELLEDELEKIEDYILEEYHR